MGDEICGEAVGRERVEVETGVSYDDDDSGVGGEGAQRWVDEVFGIHCESVKRALRDVDQSMGFSQVREGGEPRRWFVGHRREENGSDVCGLWLCPFARRLELVGRAGDVEVGRSGEVDELRGRWQRWKIEF